MEQKLIVDTLSAMPPHKWASIALTMSWYYRRSRQGDVPDAVLKLFGGKAPSARVWQIVRKAVAKRRRLGQVKLQELREEARKERKRAYMRQYMRDRRAGLPKRSEQNSLAAR